MTSLHLILLASVTLMCHVISASDECRKVATFNAALLHGVEENYERKLPQLTRALSRLDADVLCLQEVWLESDMRKIMKKLRGKYPYHYSKLHYRQGAIRKPTSEMGWGEWLKFQFSMFSPCSYMDLYNFMSLWTCAENKGCTDVEGIGSVLCILQRCQNKVKKVSNNCLACVVTMWRDFSTVNEACAPDFFEHLNDFNSPGLLLLSKTPMSNLRYTGFRPDGESIEDKGFLEAQIPGTGKVVCTHLTATYEQFPEFEEQHRAEVEKIIERFMPDEHLLIGDLNTGPEVLDFTDRDRNISAEVPNNYQTLIDAGYSAPYLSSDGRCTWCSDNPFVDDENNILDHILTAGVNITDIKRVLDNYNPRPLSDHFGVEAQVCRLT